MDATTFAKTFFVTHAARRKIAAGAAARQLNQEVVTIAKATVSGRVVWGVGFMSQGDLPENEISVASGVRFFVDAQWRKDLVEQQLDVREGAFVLVSRSVD
jgi:hypothetical protein